MSLVDRVRTSISAAHHHLASEGALGQDGLRAVDEAAHTWTVERPKRPEHGDYATNVAIVLTKKVGMPPRAVAEKTTARLGWINAIRTVSAAALSAIGISAPDRMDLPQATEDENIS